MAVYQAVYDYKNTSSGMLSFRHGDRFHVRARKNDDWWEVETEGGAVGLVPVSYLEPVEGADGTDGGGGGSVEGAFTALYDFTGHDNTQLSFKRGEQLVLLTKSDVSWWTMKSPSSGLSGLVPLNYIDVATTTTTKNTSPAHSTTAATTVGTTGNSHGNSGPHPQDELGDQEALSEVLLSVDRAIQKIHDEAVVQGGTYTAQQRAALQ
jgi:hypothetical protein